MVATQLADVISLAAEGELDHRKRVDLRWRELKMEQRIPRMTPRGSRVPWWDFSGLNGEANVTSLVDLGDEMATIALPGGPLPSSSSSASKSTSKRRRRRTTT